MHSLFYGKFLGFLLSILLLVFVIFSLLTGTLHENLFAILGFLIFNLCLSLIFPKILPQNKFFLSVKEGTKLFGKLFNKIILGIVLFFVYILGVGLVWLLSRIVRKKFLALKNNINSCWINTKNKKYDFKEMF